MTTPSILSIQPSTSTMGKVILVGAGPGDPELLTLKAVHAIASATLILVDDLVNEAVLEHAKPNARIVHVGKRGGCQSTPQSFIEKMMVSGAQKGATVVRLKGGDPMMFGRAGEEIDAMQKAGVPFEIVNGITAGLAAATSVLMPVTNRQHAHGVVFITGHPQSGGLPIDWVAMGMMASSQKLTLVIYMGVSQAADIEQGLLKHMPCATPVAIVQNASGATETSVRTDLAHLQAAISQHKLQSPAIIVVGEVATNAVAMATYKAMPKLLPVYLQDSYFVSSQKDGYNPRLVA